MKSIIQKVSPWFVMLLCLTLLTVYSCSKDESSAPEPPIENGGDSDGDNNGNDDGNSENDDLDAINSTIAELSYDADDMLNVQDTGGAASERTLTDENNTNSGPTQGKILECRTEDYSLESNFDDVAILRPTNGVVFPGALVIGNDGLLDGAPDPLSIGRSAATLRLDLPGIGEQGTIVVDDPSSNSAVQTGIDNALEWWNSNAYQEGYVNAANSSYQATTSYSSKQFSLDVGLNVEWATGSLASQFDYESSTERRFAGLVFKQVFYTVTMDTPDSPGSVFDSSVTNAQVKSAIGTTTPPAYISSVSYGRIIMVRMETTNTDTEINLDAVLEYAGGVSGVGTVNSQYDEILRESSITVVTIGGNAEAASEAINLANIDSGFGALNSVITGENAVYSRNNPGVPIAYTIRYLKDNTLAKMGYTTDYRVENCRTFNFDHENVKVENKSIYDIRFKFVYKSAGTNNSTSTRTYEVSQNKIEIESPPNGAHDVELEFEFQDAFVWRRLGDFDLGYLRSERCFKADGVFQITIEPVSCN
ncbi:MAG: thiol-activated cytolysin family protein [Croceivirga sp.]